MYVCMYVCKWDLPIASPMHTCKNIRTYIHTHVHAQKQRERANKYGSTQETKRFFQGIYAHTNIRIHTYVYTYIHTQKQRERADKYGSTQETKRFFQGGQVSQSENGIKNAESFYK